MQAITVWSVFEWNTSILGLCFVDAYVELIVLEQIHILLCEWHIIVFNYNNFVNYI